MKDEGADGCATQRGVLEYLVLVLSVSIGRCQCKIKRNRGKDKHVFRDGDVAVAWGHRALQCPWSMRWKRSAMSVLRFFSFVSMTAEGEQCVFIPRRCPPSLC